MESHSISHRQLFLDHIGQTSDFPLLLEIEKAEGVYLHSKTKSYIDLISGIGVSNIGHRHPKVISAIKDQLDQYLHVMVYGEFVKSPQTLLAKAITSTLPKSLNNVYFVNSGSEAIEGAVKLAKRYTGRPNVVSFKNAYHGSTHGALSFTGNEDLKRNFRPLLPGISHIEYGNEADFSYINEQTACVLIEMVQGEAGVNFAPKEYYLALAKHCKENGVLLIADEIQTGFGRTGKFWAHEHFGITPDIITTAKGMGGGLPIGAFISSIEIMSVLRNNPILGHITTFGGNPVCCAASLATLQVIQEEKLTDSVGTKANLILEQLKNLKGVQEIRNKGLMMAVEFESFEVLKPVIDQAIENGVLTDWFLFNDKSMRIAPPLTISEEEITEACNAIEKAVKSVLG